MSPTRLRPELYFGKKSEKCLNPKCNQDMSDWLFRYKNHYCSYECYCEYPFLQAIVEKKHGKPLRIVFEEVLSLEGMTEKTAAKMLGVSCGTIGKWKKKYGADIREYQKRITQIDFEDQHERPLRQVLVEALNSNLRQRDTAKQLGISLNTLKRWMDECEIQKVTYFE